MLVKQRVASIEQWNTISRDPSLDAVRCEHGLVVTGTYVDAGDANTVIVVMDMHDLDKARQFASLPTWLRPVNRRELAAPRTRCGTERAKFSDRNCEKSYSQREPRGEKPARTGPGGSDHGQLPLLAEVGR